MLAVVAGIEEPPAMCQTRYGQVASTKPSRERGLRVTVHDLTVVVDLKDWEGLSTTKRERTRDGIQFPHARMTHNMDAVRDSTLASLVTASIT